jgi:protein-S-isoprenylcysteine O-methyltransferase Ste14/membrane-associated phospholipid phosphatase
MKGSSLPNNNAPPGTAKKALIIIGYTLFFWGIVPALFFGIGKGIDTYFHLHWHQSYGSQGLGLLLAVFGCGILFWSIGQLWFQGKGLPISHLPPTEFVAQGLYTIWRHPIYIGFTMAFAGGSALAGSFGAFCGGTIALTLAWVAYTKWLEEPALCERFGETYRQYCSQVGRFGPKGSDRVPVWVKGTPTDLTGLKRLKYAIIFAICWVTWAALYTSIGAYALGQPTNQLWTPIDRLLPFVPKAEFVYAFCYLVPLFPLFFAKTESQLHRILFCFLGINVIAFSMFLLFPIFRPRPTFAVDSWATYLLNWEYTNDRPVNNFPSLHAAIAWLVYLGCRGRWKLLDWFLLTTAIGIGIAAVLVKQHYIVDILAGKSLSAAIWHGAGSYFPENNEKTATKTTT